MPDEELTAAQRTTLLTLMIKGGTLPRAFLVDTVKISLDKARRDDLVTQRLITVTGKPMVLELTEKGWGRAIQELSSDMPPRGGALGGTLYLLLDFLRNYLERNDLSAAEFFTSGAPSRLSGAPSRLSGPPSRLSGAPSRLSVTAPEPDADIEAQIRKAYDGMAPRPGAYVMLADLRAALSGGHGADEVDAAVRRLDKAPDVHLVPESNQKVLTQAQRAAAVRIGNQDMHLLAIRS